MRKSEIFRSLVGSAFIYVVMAACNAAGTSSSATGPEAAEGSSGSGHGGSGHGGESAKDAGGLLDALADAITNPVPDAQAAPTDDVSEGTCDEEINGNYYARHAYPGKSAKDLGRAVVLFPSNPAYAPPEAKFEMGIWYIADGAVIAPCSKSKGMKVTFILPASCSCP